MDWKNCTSVELLGLLKLDPYKYSINELSDKLESFETDEERMSFLRQLTPLKHEDFLSTLPTNIQGHKSLSKSLELRRKGNAVFQKKVYHSAITLYTESVATAPYPSDNLGQQTDCTLDSETESALSLALSNRSAVLFELKKYVSCLKDISFALKTNYPSNLQYKLYIRRLKCFKILKTGDKGITINLALQSLSLTDNITEDKKQALKEEIHSLEIYNSGDVNNDNKQENISMSNVKVKPSYGPNINLSGCSDCIEMKVTPDMGRGLFATRDIEIGDIIATAKPFACVLYDDFMYKNCHHCLKKCSTLIPCSQCSLVLFCCEHCLRTAWESYHSMECKILPILKYKLFPSTVRMLRIVIIAANMFGSLTKYYEATKLFDVFRQKCNDWYPRTILGEYFNYYQVYEPVKNSPSVTKLFANYIIGTYLSLVLEKGTDFYSKHFIEDQNNSLLLDKMKTFIARLLMRHVKNATHEVRNVEDNTTKFSLVAVGEATYPESVNLINHSCNPNCFNHTAHDNQIVIRAQSAIKTGEQFFDSYCGTYDQTPLKDRRIALSRHSFVCQCIACAEHWPISSELCKQKLRFKCEFCTSELQLTQMPPETEECGMCHRKNEISIFMETLVAFLNDHHAAGLSDIILMIKLASTHLFEPNCLILSCQQILREYLYIHSFDDED